MSTPRRIVVTDVQHPIGRHVLDALRDTSAVEFVGGLVTRAGRRADKGPDVETLPIAPDHRPFAAYLREHRIDTVVQCGLAPDRSGGRVGPEDVDVIGTMCAGAAVGNADAGIRSWVTLSSSSIYPIDSHASLLQREEDARAPDPEAPQAALAEAEDYARDVAIRHPHINVGVLRLQQLAGRGLSGSLAAVFEQDPVPSPIGFDPAIQLLHADDAAAAVTFAALHELAGVYNVASTGQIRWDAAMRVAGDRGAPVFPVGAWAFAPLMERLRLPHLPDDIVPLARFGQAIDTTKIERAGFRPKHDQTDCFDAIRAGRARARPARSAR